MADHNMGLCVSHLVAKTLRRNDGDLIADALVGLEVESQLGVVALDDDLGGALDGLEEKKILEGCSVGEYFTIVCSP